MPNCVDGATYLPWNKLKDVTTLHNNRYSESQIYEYIARVFNNVVFSAYLGSNAAGNEFNILIAFLHISGLLIYLE